MNEELNAYTATVNRLENAYTATVNRLEPEVTPVDECYFNASAAISLKRIADTLEVISQRPTKEEYEAQIKELKHINTLNINEVKTLELILENKSNLLFDRDKLIAELSNKLSKLGDSKPDAYASMPSREEAEKDMADYYFNNVRLPLIPTVKRWSMRVTFTQVIIVAIGIAVGVLVGSIRVLFISIPGHR